MSESPARATSILVVDDHADTVKVLAKLLKSAGYSVSAAGSLAEARRICQATKFDLVIADVSLPDGNGLDLLPQIAETCPAKGIIVSGDSKELYKHVSATSQWSDYLVKPIMFENLLASIGRVLAGS